MAVGIAFRALHISVSDDYLRRNFGGDLNGARVRQIFRGGWKLVVLGIVMIGFRYISGGGS
jgi:hypothetical protein